MGTVSNSLASTTASTFNGTSQYAADLQQAINQAVTIASIPVTQLQNNVTTLQGQASEVSALQTDFGVIQTAIQTLASGGASSLAATVGDSTIVTANVDTTAAATAGTYTINVISAGSSTTTLSNDNLPTVSNPATSSISTSGTYTLTVGTSTFTITPTSNTLNALAQSINSAGAGVSATLVNIGSPTAPDYRLSLQATSLGDAGIQLNDGSQDLLQTLSTGSSATYQVDGQPSTPISSNSASVTIAPGVTVNLLQAGQTTVTVAPDSSAAANTLSSLVTAYNNASAELGANHGTAGGPLTGQSLIYQLEQSLRDLVNYSGGSGSVQNLASLGLSLNDQGQLSFNQSQFESAEATNPNGVAAFLGSATGGGFLTTATNVLNGLEDPATGIFQGVTASLQKQISADNDNITADQARITTMQNALTEQMAEADAAIASLESQVSYFTTLFTDQQQNSVING
jgi:flagellar hook-associated protein 2